MRRGGGSGVTVGIKIVLAINGGSDVRHPIFQRHAAQRVGINAWDAVCVVFRRVRQIGKVEVAVTLHDLDAVLGDTGVDLVDRCGGHVGLPCCGVLWGETTLGFILLSTQK